jgi:hypothetical protein
MFLELTPRSVVRRQLLKNHILLNDDRSKFCNSKRTDFQLRLETRDSGRGFRLHHSLSCEAARIGMGDSMTAISLGQTVRPSRLGRMAITAAIKFGRWTNDGYSVGPAQVSKQFGGGNVTARSQEFAGGFVDFLLGRGVRHPR